MAATKAARRKSSPAKVAATKAALSKSTMSSEIRKVTPEVANEWLDANEVNRNTRPKLVAAYRRDMEAGRWVFTGEPIQISRSGRLLNGQHRLQALAGANVESLDLLVVTGLPDDSQKMMDQGAPRSVVDALVMGGHIKNVALVASLCRWVIISPECGPHLTPNLLRQKITAAEVLETYREHSEELDLAADRGAYLRGNLPGSPTAYGYAFHQMHRIDPVAANEYWAGLRDMEWSWRHDPRKAAMRRIQAIHRDPEVKTSLETAVLMVSVFSRTWNAWRKHEDMDSIMVRSRQGVIPPATLR